MHDMEECTTVTVECCATDFVQAGEKGRMEQMDKKSQAEHSSDPVEIGSTWFGDLMCQRIMYFAGRDINKIQTQSH